MNCKYCTKKAIKKGLCQTHYMRLYRHGDPLVVNKTSKLKNRLCTIPDCNRKHYGKGLCFMHYLRNRRHNDPLVVINRRGRKYKIKKEC